MISKSTFQTINKVLSWIISIVLIGFGIFHFFVHKISLTTGSNFVIFWSVLGLGGLSNIIDANFFENDFTLKKNRFDIFTVAMAILIIILEVVL